jgi:hypothetical protein
VTLLARIADPHAGGWIRSDGYRIRALAGWTRPDLLGDDLGIQPGLGTLMEFSFDMVPAVTLWRHGCGATMGRHHGVQSSFPVLGEIPTQLYTSWQQQRLSGAAFLLGGFVAMLPLLASPC